MGANGKPVVTTVAAAAAPAPTPAPPATIARTPGNLRQPWRRPSRNRICDRQRGDVAQPAPLPGQQDAEAIRSAALAFLQQQSAGLPGKIDITVAPAFPRGLAACTVLEPFMPSGARLWGRMTVGVRCAGERPWTIYLQARISLRATYYLAARAMAPGEVLTAADLVARDGDLTGLPQAIVTDPSQAVGSVSLVRIAGGMPLRRDMLKSASAVSIGQTVRVVAAGHRFRDFGGRQRDEQRIARPAGAGEDGQRPDHFRHRQGWFDGGDPVVSGAASCWRPGVTPRPRRQRADGDSTPKGPDLLERQGKIWSDCAKVLITGCRYQDQIVQEANRESRFHNQFESADVERRPVPLAAKRRDDREQQRAKCEHVLAAHQQRRSGDASVSLSGLSQHLRSLAASGSADIDTAHVESIKQAIKDGTLQIDSSKIADGVLNTARELLQSKTSSTGN